MKKICFILVLCCFWISANAAIRIGVPLYAPPFVQLFDPRNGLSGFDIDLMKMVCSRLSWDCNFIPMKYDKLLPALKENKIDFAIGSIVITPEKQQTFLFSTPYLMSDAGFLVMKDSPIKTVSELKGKSVGVVKGKAYMSFLQAKFPDEISVVPYDVFRKLAFDLSSGKIDAVCMNYMGALFIENQQSGAVKVLGEHFRFGGGMGIAAMPTNKDNMDKINKVILQFQKDGTFTDLYNYTFQFIIPQQKSNDILGSPTHKNP
jgi:arginine transport system substrate-binding protein